MTTRTLQLLLDLARATGLPKKLRGMFSGELLNPTEQRPVLHTALRAAPGDGPIVVGGEDVLPLVWEGRRKVTAFANAVRAGEFRGATGKVLKNVVVIGIGGSSLGPAFLYEALRATHLYASLEGRQLRFLANIDELDAARAIAQLDAAETLVLITSKTFRTRETLINGCTMRTWLREQLGGSASAAVIDSRHIAACTTDAEAALRWGVSEELIFPFWEWVGGRFSVTSSVGQLPIALAFGPAVFDEFLDGARDIDRHCLEAPLQQNLPVLMGLLGVWNLNFLNHTARAIFPYCEALWRLPAHVQQVEMESNGKRVSADGQLLDYHAAEVTFGEPGTTGQHSFFQLLHMGQTVPADFLGFAQTPGVLSFEHTAVPLDGNSVSHHDELMANFFAQPDALACGCTPDELREMGVPESLVPHRTFPGDRPSSVFLLPRLTAFAVGQLLALYEHRTAVQGFVCGVNSFDQWGVELGKELAGEVRSQMRTARSSGEAPVCNLPSTTRLLAKYLELAQREVPRAPAAVEAADDSVRLPAAVRECVGEAEDEPCPLES